MTYSRLFICLRISFIFSVILFLSFILNVTVGSAESHIFNNKNNLQPPDNNNTDLKIKDCIGYQNRDRPYRIVLQIINGTFHKWREYDVDNEGYICIVLEEPEFKELSAEEARHLLQVSRKGLKRNESFLHNPVKNNVETNFTKNQEIFSEIQLEQQEIDYYALITPDYVKSFPWNTIGQLLISSGNDNPTSGHGTGFLIAPYTVLTNAHNLYKPEYGGWYELIVFCPGSTYDEKSNQIYLPYELKRAIGAEIHPDYLSYYNDPYRRVEFDYGAIFIDEPIPGISTFMPISYYPIDNNISIAGYPQDNYIFALDGAMWFSTGTIYHLEPGQISFYAYGAPGSSGSPILHIDSNNYLSFIGMLSVGSPINPYGYSAFRGPIFSQNSIGLIEKWMKWTPEPTAPRDKVKLIATEETGFTGEQVVVSIFIENASGVEGGQFDLLFDESKVKTTLLTRGSFIPDIPENTFDYNLQLDDGVLRVLWLNESGSYSSDLICTITFDLLEIGISELVFSNIILIPEEYEIADPYSGLIIVQGYYELGDVNNDGVIDVLDVTKTMQHVLGLVPLTPEEYQAADVNLDGFINVMDVTLLMQYALGLIDSF